MSIIYHRLNLFFLLLFLLPSFVFSQKTPVFKISSFRYDFGTIKGNGGKVSHSFPIENTGGDTLRVLKIKNSAENINTSFAPFKIAPGGKGEIIITYDPSEDKGKTEKFASVRTNDPQNPIRQFGIQADVIPFEKTIADNYPQRMGNLKMKTKHIAMDKLLSTEIRTDTFFMYNDWSKTITLALKNPPAHISWKIQPSELAPGKEGLIIVTYDAAKSGNFGQDLEYFRLGTNDSIDPEKILTIGLNILEDFSYLKGNPDKRAKVRFETTTHNFGNIKTGSTVDFSYPIENIGKGDLVIRKTKAGCGCTLAKMDKTVLKPGENTFVRVYFNTSGMLGGESKSVTVICNDPDNPVTVLTFSANVEK